MFGDDEDEKPFLKLRQQHQQLADDLGMTTEEYLAYRLKIEKEEIKRRQDEYEPVGLKLIKHTCLRDNVENLGFSRYFFTEEDAEFLYDKILEWENDTSYMISTDESEYNDVTRQERIASFVLTGVKYHFEEIGVSIYSFFEFEQSDYYNYDSCIEYHHSYYYYNHRNNEFRDIRKEEFMPLIF